VACATSVKPFDFGIANEGNCKVYKWLQDHGPANYTYSRAQLADPAVAASVAKLEQQMRTQRNP
jgi:hypothetical protein